MSKNVKGVKMEYKEFAKYYDKFYQNKNYEKEVEFIKKIIKKEDKIIDIGCGTGIHASLLEEDGFNIDGLDISKEMLELAKTRIKGNLYNQDILDMNINNKYDVIISMFAVLNHLTDLEELKRALINLKKILQADGKIIIDLHNPQSSGQKTDSYNNFTRTMRWKYDKNTKIEKSEIVFEINNNTFVDSHVFRIFTIDEVVKTCKEIGLTIVGIYENYDIKKIGNNLSKNLQFLIMNK